MVQSGLVGHWPLAEQSGRANDLSGNDNHGTLNGGVTQGVVGVGGLTSYSFDGSDDFVAMNARVIDGPPYSISFWLRPDSLGSLDITQWEGGENGGRDFHVSNNTDYGIGITFKDSNNNSVDVRGDASISTNEWVHGVAVVTENGEFGKVYIDGELVTTASNTNGYNDNTPNTVIGYNPAGNNNYTDGSISDVRMYNRALSPQEIQTLYEWGSDDYTDQTLHDGTDSGAVSRYEFTSGSVTTDSWGSNTLTDNTSAGTTTDAIEGDAKSFDGTDDNMTANDSASLDITNAITVSAWINVNVSDSGIISKDDYALWVDNNTNIQPFFQIYDNGTAYQVQGDDILPAGGWLHLVGTYDGETIKLHINGTLNESLSHTGSIDTNNSPLTIGDLPNFSGYFAGGTFDDIRIYDRALSDREVFDLYRWGSRGIDGRKKIVTK
jgi:hypothetical protein